MLEIDPFNRPSAVEAADILQLIRQGKIPPVGKLNGPQGRVAVIRPPSPPRNITVTQVQYRRSSPSFPSPFFLTPSQQKVYRVDDFVGLQGYFAEDRILEQQNEPWLQQQAAFLPVTLPPPPIDSYPLNDILPTLEQQNMRRLQHATQGTNSRCNDLEPSLTVFSAGSWPSPHCDRAGCDGTSGREVWRDSTSSPLRRISFISGLRKSTPGP